MRIRLRQGLPAAALGFQARIAREKSEAQASIRTAIDQWAGVVMAKGLGHEQAMRAFYLTFGVDVLTAQTGTAKDMLALKERIERTWQ